ncbi:MAG: hypothetical protein SH850_30860 [Planctomycetaceae bacterium]|nr:hypothetical protein [Planctomycetaceae bacterium]
MEEPETTIQTLESEIVALEHQLHEAHNQSAVLDGGVVTHRLAQRIAALDGHLSRLHASAAVFQPSRPI